eukprot:scaffold180909_cov53-Cyclotella_meneghiniana.AAC.2
MSLPTAHKCLHAAYACVLSRERYKGRWHSMKTLQAMGNQLSPDGLILNGYWPSTHLALRANRHMRKTGLPEGTILAIRRIEKQKKTDGLFTVVGRFHRDSILDETSARRVDAGNTLGRASIQSDDAYRLPPRVAADLKSYANAAHKKGRKYFVKESEYPPTPQLKNRQRPPILDLGAKALVVAMIT